MQSSQKVKNKMKKRAEGLPINMIILAILALAVLVVFIVIFTKTSGNFSSTINSCESKGGECVQENQCQYQKTGFTCLDKQVCCINPLKG